jgi:hypothetical protein
MMAVTEAVKVRKHTRQGRPVASHDRKLAKAPTGRFGGYLCPEVCGVYFDVYCNYDEDPLVGEVADNAGRVATDIVYCTLEEAEKVADEWNHSMDGWQVFEDTTPAQRNWRPSPGMVMAYKK